jgi:hypothetical protein
MTIDFDEIERKARAASTGPWHVGSSDPSDYRAVLREEPNGDVYEVANDVDPADAEHIAAAPPLIVLALIARIRELEAGFRRAIEFIESQNQRSNGRPRPDPWRVLLDKGAVLHDAPEWGVIRALRDRLDAAETIAKAATAFVDEQGKLVDIGRGYTIDLPEDFAATEFEALVRAVEEAGR